MTAIVTDQFRVKNAADFKASVDSAKVYVTLGKIQSWADDINPPVPTSSIVDSVYDVWNAAYAARRVGADDIRHVIPRNNWVSGDTTYVPYNPADPLLLTKKFHTVVDDGGTFKVYKLIVKGPGATTVKPTHTTAAIPAAGGDGYAWKYMYTITTADYLKFATDFYIPVVNISGNVASGAGGGATPLPIGGHGVNNIAELGAYSVAINARFAYDEGGLLPVVNDFRQVAFIENPLQFNGTAGVYGSGDAGSGAVVSGDDVLNLSTVITLTSASGTFQSDEVVSSPTGTANVVGHDVIGNKLHVQLTSGTFTTGQALSAPSGAAATAGAITAPGAQLYSGKVIYIENRRPVARSGDQTESITTVIEF